MKKRILSFLLVLCMTIGYMPAISVVTQAAGSSIIYVSDFESLKEAFATVQTENGKVVTTRIKLTQDITFVPNREITIRNYGDAPRSVQLDLNGHSLYKNDNAVYMFHVGYTGNLNNDYDDNKVDETYLEIINSNKAVTSKMTLIKENSKTAKFAQVKHKGHMVIGGDDGGPIEISGFVHSAIQVGNLDNYSFIPNFQATVDIKNGVTIKDCKTHSSVSKEYGGGIYVYKGGTANLYDGTTIEGCTCCKTNTTRQDEGGGVYVAGTFNMYGGTIKNCVAESAESRGGGVYVATGGTFNMYDGLITENSAAAGGGVGLWGGHFNMYGGEIKNNYASNCGNEIAMLYGTEDISVTINGGKITHEASYSGCGSQLFVNGDNSKMQILTGSEILLDGKKNGFGGSGDVLIKGGYLKVQGLSSAFTKAPTIENMDMASGDRDAEKMILSPTEADFYKPGVILGEKGKLMVTVTFEHPIMSDFLPNTTPDPVKVIKGTCLLSLPVVSDTNGKYFYAGWKNEYETGGGYWSLSTPVDKSIILTSQWNQYNVYFKDFNGKPVGGFDFETTYGYSYNESAQIIISNQNAPVILNVDNSYKYFEISQFYAGGNQGYTYTLPSNGQCGLYIKPKSNVDAGTYSENIVVQMSADGNDYSAERTIPVTLVVKKGKPEIMSSPIADFTYGQTLEDAVLTGGKATQFQYYDEETKSFLRDVPGKFTFVDGSIKPGVGDAQPFDVVFTPDDIVNYEEVKCKGYAYVGKMVIKDLQTPTIGYSIPYGTPLSDIELPTGWKWADESIVPKPGVSQQVVYFEFEEDLSNYDFSGSQSSELDFENNRVMKKTSVETEKLNPIVDWPTASDIKQGQKLSDSVLSGGSAYVVINGKTVDVPGTFEWKSPNEIPAVGTNYYGVVFIPDNTEYYESDESEISVKTMETFTVDFMPDNGTKISSQTIAIGGKITEPSNVTKDGYALLGWYKGDTKWDFDNDTVTENILLKAKWKDITAPAGEISIVTKKWDSFLNTITFCLFFKNKQEVTITASDNSGDAVTIEYLLSDKELNKTELAKATFTAYTKAFSIKPDNKYVIYAKLTDHADNVTYLSSDGIVLDATAPVISGVENGKTYCEAQTVTVDEKYIDSVTVNGTEVPLDDNKQFTLPAKGTQKIVATDKAGNVSAEITVTVNDEHTYEWQSENGQYWKKCKFCDDETAKKDIPTITINGADSVCRTQDYKFSFTLLEGATDAVYGYEFENKGDLWFSAIIENNEPHGVVSFEWYEPSENSFKVYAGAKTSDGFEFFVSKTVALKSGHTDAASKDHICDICGATLSEHTGGEATCTSKAICEYCGNEYGKLDSSNHNLENIPAKAATVTATGNKEYWHCKDCGKYFADRNGENEIELNDTVIQKLSPEIIDGMGQSVTEGEKKELTFRSNAAFGDFIRVELDGKTLDEKDYTVKEGSTVVTLKADYVGSLSVDEYTIGIVSESGTAATTFTVHAKAAADNDTMPQQTGDNSMMWLWVALLFVSGFGVVVTTVYSKKRASAK